MNTQNNSDTHNWHVTGFMPQQVLTPYEVACKFIQELKQIGFDANIIQNGVCVTCTHKQLDTIKRIARQYETEVLPFNPTRS